MRINIFKNTELFESLKKHNELPELIYKEYIEDLESGKHVPSWWFDPKKVNALWLKIRGTEPLWKITLKNSYELILYQPNYLGIFLLDLLYRDKKDILIEDSCCGISRFSYYLSKLGYTNFSFVDNFSQMPQKFLESFWKKVTELNPKVKHMLNDCLELKNQKIISDEKNKSKPVVVNHCGYPSYPKIKGFNIETTELVCVYCNNALLKDFGSFLKGSGYVELCEEQNLLSIAYCRKDKYDEFKKQLEEYKVHVY